MSTLRRGPRLGLTAAAEPDPHWLERAKAVEATQSRYLWLLLVLTLFYPALHLQTASVPGTVKVPFVDLVISTVPILASGTGVLSLIVLAIVGTMRALRRAQETGLSWRTGEEFDVHPNVIGRHRRGDRHAAVDSCRVAHGRRVGPVYP